MNIGEFNFAMLTDAEKKLPFYLVGAGFDFHQELDPHERPSGYPHYQWIQVEKGSGLLTIEGEQHLVGENQGMLIFPSVPHEYHASESPWIVNWFTFNGRYIEDFLKEVPIDHSGVYSVVQPGVFSSKIRRSLDLLQSSNSLKGLEGSSLVYDFLISFVKFAHPADRDSVSSLYSRLNPVLHFIDGNYDKPLTIEEMSDILAVTPQYLCRLFKKIIGQRPIEYLNNVRINKSKDILLKNPRMKISQVSHKSGYESPSYFCSIFKKLEGMSPGHFRELHLHQNFLNS